MLGEIGSLDNVPAFIDSVKAGEGRLMGFGHRVYKNYDPRATIIKKTAYDVFEVTGKNPLLDIALKLEETALSDPYFVDRKLYPNVDFYSGLIYQAMGFPVAMFTVLFAIPVPRAGWRTGRNCSTTRSKRSAVLASGTPVWASATTPTSPAADRFADRPEGPAVRSGLRRVQAEIRRRPTGLRRTCRPRRRRAG
ncbi:MAG: citrate/2-methylcitrate synthase [Ilumatobacteraceae bacterium]